MEKDFGPTVVCKKPPTSGVPERDVAFVQFQRKEDSEKAVEVLKKGYIYIYIYQVIYIYTVNKRVL